MIKKYFCIIFILFSLTISQLSSEETKMIMKLKYGSVEIELFEDIAPNDLLNQTLLARNLQYLIYTCLVMSEFLL